MSIIIVDDNEVNLFVMNKILKGAGYNQTKAFTSAQALYKYLKLEEPYAEPVAADLILLDIMMPEVDGIAACRHIRQHERYKDLPIIFVTSLDDSQKLVEALDAGGTDYISKPINKMELLARMRVALRLKKELDWRKQNEKKIRKELNLAAQVQQGLLNKPIEEDIQIDIVYRPSSALSGDMYYWQKFDDGRYGVMLFDVMGHGISSSLVSMFVSSILREAMRTLKEPVRVIQELNRQMTCLHREGQDTPFYFTGIYLIIDPHSKSIEYINAGHPPGYAHIDGSETIALKGGSCAIGFFEEIEVESNILTYEDHVQLLVFTDGVYEAMKMDEKEADVQLRDLTALDWQALPPVFSEFMDRLPDCQPDDICLMAIKV